MRNGPQIVTSDILMCLDASDRNSYSGSGTTWLDTSGNGYTATLVNSPSYSNTRSGILQLDGTDDRVDMSSSLLYPVAWSDYFTLETWINVPADSQWSPPTTGYPTGVTGTIIGKGNYFGSLGLVRQSGIGINGNTLGIFMRGSTAIYYAAGDITRDAWFNIVGTWDGSAVSLYINGNLTSTAAGTVAGIGGSPSNAAWNFAGQNAYGGNIGSNFKCSVSNIRMYSRALTSQQVRQNFNALRGRFGV